MSAARRYIATNKETAGFDRNKNKGTAEYPPCLFDSRMSPASFYLSRLTLISPKMRATSF
ncbi:hypothetical protein GGD46_002499 [Rhizobium lusitanum]|uniref:Uncharacterized protein n=1 Tax=Rhizobium lusitanum TaxID=293958 RepID=A0A7X0IQX6_9HYPH|nr:hypothetical protein [Rhizobium lusitanum]